MRLLVLGGLGEHGTRDDGRERPQVDVDLLGLAAVAGDDDRVTDAADELAAVREVLAHDRRDGDPLVLERHRDEVQLSLAALRDEVGRAVLRHDRARGARQDLVRGAPDQVPRHALRRVLGRRPEDHVLGERDHHRGVVGLDEHRARHCAVAQEHRGGIGVADLHPRAALVLRVRGEAEVIGVLLRERVDRGLEEVRALRHEDPSGHHRDHAELALLHRLRVVEVLEPRALEHRRRRLGVALERERTLGVGHEVSRLAILRDADERELGGIDGLQRLPERSHVAVDTEHEDALEADVRGLVLPDQTLRLREARALIAAAVIAATAVMAPTLRGGTVLRSERGLEAADLGVLVLTLVLIVHLDSFEFRYFLLEQASLGSSSFESHIHYYCVSATLSVPKQCFEAGRVAERFERTFFQKGNCTKCAGGR